MRTENREIQLAATVFLLVACAGFANAQAPAARRGTPAPQPGAAATQTFAVGDAVEIQAADGSWIAGTVTSIDPATGKYQVLLVNSMSGLAAGSSLRRVPAPASAMPAAQTAPGAPPAVCASQPMCMEVRNLGATITDFRLSTQGVNQIVDVTIRFVNKTAGPLAFGYVGGSGTIIDDEGNRYNINENTIRGMGVVRGDTPDAKFVLQPGDNGDALFQFTFAHNQEMLGSAYELDLTVREMTPTGGNQYTVGAEYPLRFTGAGQTAMSGPVVSEAAPATSPKASGPAAAKPGGAQGGRGPGAAGATAATGGGSGKSGGSSVIAGLSQVETLIPGFRSNTAGAAGASGSAGSGAAAKTASPGSAPAASQTKAAPAPATGQPAAASTASGLAAAIPGFSAGAGSATTSTVASTAANLIPGFSAPAPVAAVPGLFAPAPAPALVATAVPTVAKAPVDPCAGQAHCLNAGPFAAQVNQLVGIPGPAGYILRAQVEIRNVSAQAVTLSYVGRSASAADNLGNRFGPSMNGAAEQSVAGMGTVGTPQAGVFILNPGQARSFSVAVVRPEAVKTAVGTAFNVNMQVSEMGAVAGRAAPVRAFPLSFAGVACQSCAAVPAAVTAGAAATTGNPAANALRNLIRK